MGSYFIEHLNHVIFMFILKNMNYDELYTFQKRIIKSFLNQSDKQI